MTHYPMLRAALDPQWRDVSDDFLDSFVPLTHGGMSADDVENFWKSVARLSKAAAPVLQTAGQVAVKALPGVIQGASTGAALGPYGAIAGGLIGGVGSVLASPNQPSPGPAGTTPPSPTTPTVAPSTPVGTGGGPVPTGAQPGAGATAAAAAATAPTSAAVLQLLQLLTDPAVIRALRSAALGPMGRREVVVAHERVSTVDVLDVLADTMADVADAARALDGEGADGADVEWVRHALGVRPIAGYFDDDVADAADEFDARVDHQLALIR